MKIRVSSQKSPTPNISAPSVSATLWNVMYRVDVWQHAWQLNGSNSNKNWSSLVFITRKIPKDCNVLHRISTKYIHTYMYCIQIWPLWIRMDTSTRSFSTWTKSNQKEQFQKEQFSQFCGEVLAKKNKSYCCVWTVGKQRYILLPRINPPKNVKKSLFWVKTVFEIGGRTQTNKKRSGNLNREFVSPTYELHRYSKSNSYKLITVPFFWKLAEFKNSLSSNNFFRNRLSNYPTNHQTICKTEF